MKRFIFFKKSNGEKKYKTHLKGGTSMKGWARSDLRARPDLFAALCIYQRSYKRTCFAFKPEKFSSGHGGDGF